MSSWASLPGRTCWSTSSKKRTDRRPIASTMRLVPERDRKQSLASKEGETVGCLPPAPVSTGAISATDVIPDRHGLPSPPAVEMKQRMTEFSGIERRQPTREEALVVSFLALDIAFSTAPAGSFTDVLADRRRTERTRASLPLPSEEQPDASGVTSGPTALSRQDRRQKPTG